MECSLNIVKNNFNCCQVINKSKFIAYIFDTEKENYQDILKNLKKQHLSATHICYAYRFCNTELNLDNNSILNFTQGYFDDGEPSGTAGAPILKAIINHNLCNVLIAVVRYFGGIKLGANGLIKAYFNSAELAIKDNIRTIYRNKVYKISANYSQFNVINNYALNNNLNIISKDFDDKVSIIVGIVFDKDLDFLIGIVGKNNVDYIGDRFI